MTNRKVSRAEGRRITVTFVVVLFVLFLTGLMVVQPWRRGGASVTVVAVVLGLLVPALVGLAVLRSARNRPDWYQARMWTVPDDGVVPDVPSPDDRIVTTVLCTDLVARGVFLTFVHQLHTLLAVPVAGGPSRAGVAIRVEPLARENRLHVVTPPAEVAAGRTAVLSALRVVGVDRVELRSSPPGVDAAGPEPEHNAG
ncbi:hypothetical protein ACQSSU_13895 [Micromonospora echinospora]